MKRRKTSRMDARESETRHIMGRHLRKARTLRGLTLVELSERLAVSYQQMQKYESGVNSPSLAKLAALAQTLGVPIGYFFGATGAAEPDADPLNIKDSRLMRRLRQIEQRRPHAYLAICELVAAMTAED